MGTPEIVTIKDDLTQSNCYIIENKGKVVIIDPNHFDQIHTLLQKEKWTPEYVILTHEHCDHMQGLNELRNIYPLTVVTSLVCSEGIQSAKNNMSKMMEVYLYFKSGEKETFSYKPFVCEPADLTFLNEMEFIWQENHFKMVLVPGHTRGSICIFLNKSLLFSGDYLLPGEEVITRLPGGDTKEYEEIGKPWLKKLSPGLTVYPGHGDVFELTKEVLKDHEL